MSDWPEDWFRDGSGASQAPRGGPGSADPTEKLPAGTGRTGAAGADRARGDYPPSEYPHAGRRGAGGPGEPGAAGSAWPAQPPSRSAPPGAPLRGAPPRGAPGGDEPRPPARGPGGPARPSGAGGAGRRLLRPRRIVAIICALLALLIVVVAGMYFYLNSQLTRRNVLVDYAGRPAAAAGQNWLITGSDSRQGLTAKQERQLATGHDIGGHRSDTILVLHMPSNGGPPVLISLPRDSYVEIPGVGMNKINAAFAFGGAKLLAKTVQDATGLRIDHYMEIGFGGFVHVVDAVGGVNMCIRAPLRDPAAGLNLKKGCQTLDGAQALGYVRTRHDFANQDLQRIQDQRLFMKALLKKMTGLGTILNPFASIPAALGAADTLTVDNGTNLYQLVRVAFALRSPETTTVPIATGETLSVGDVLIWDHTKATQLFDDLKNDQRVPKSLLTGSKQAAG
jgi:LCP family protein required for cell wall assembly